MILYLDANVLVGIFLPDALACRIDAALRSVAGLPAESVRLSDFGEAEFIAVVGRRHRARDLTGPAAREAVADFDQWAAQSARVVPTLSSDLAAATAYLRRLDLNLRAPDAIHIAIAHRLGATLLTFDARMREAAAALGCKVFQG